MTKPDPIRGNIPEFSVSELAFSLKRTLEENYGHVRVRGELSRVTFAASGHMYSTLKDDQAAIDSVCWKGTIPRLGVRPEEGLEVVCTGRISTYPARSNYQLIIDSMELAGQGALLKMLEERKKKLAAEGLFDEDRKKKLPFLPGVIGVVTSPTGAVIRDILHRLADRFPCHVLVWPVLVQGTGAAEQVAAAINGFQSIDQKGLPRPDLIIVARGGGSLEDLMPFNEEIVVRAAAASKIPLISAVGHETDTTLIDYASDLRAPTPTGAAEMAVPVRAELLAQILKDQQRMVSGMARLVSESSHRLEARAKALGDPRKLVELKAQQIDHAGDKITRVYREYIGLKINRVTQNAAKLRHPAERLETARQNLVRWSDQLTRTQKHFADNLENKLNALGRTLEAYSFKKVLDRGFAVVMDEGGTPITDPAATKPGQNLRLQFKDDKGLEATAGKTFKASRT